MWKCREERRIGQNVLVKEGFMGLMKHTEMLGVKVEKTMTGP